MSSPSPREPGAAPQAGATAAALGAQLAHSWSSLQHWPWRETLRTLQQRFREDRLGLTASSLTFTTIIALVPLATVMLAVFTAFPIFGSFRKALEMYFIQNLIPDTIAKPVLGMLTQFALKANRLGTAGLAALLLTAIALMLTIDRTLNAIWRVHKPRPIAQRVLVYWAAATLGPLVLGVSLSLTSYAISASRGIVGGLPGGVAVALNVFELVLTAGTMAAMFRFVPNTHVRWHHAWAGGAFVALGFETAKQVLAWYLRAVPTYSTIYGAAAFVPIFLIWLYVGWVIVLLGAVIAAYSPSLQMRVARHPATPGHRFALALLLLAALKAARAGSEHGLTLAELSERLRADPLQIAPLLEELIRLDWVGRLEEDGGQRHVLMIEPAVTAAAPLVRRLMLAPTGATAAFWARADLADMRLDDVLPA